MISQSFAYKKWKTEFPSPILLDSLQIYFWSFFPYTEFTFYHHGNQSEISVVRIFKNTTLFSKPSNIQKSPFSAWRMEISVKLGKNTSPHPHEKHSSKLNQQTANGAKKEFSSFYSPFIMLLRFQLLWVHYDIPMEFVNSFLHPP